MKQIQPVIIASLLLIGVVILELSFSLNTVAITPYEFDGTVISYSDTTERHKNYGNSTIDLDSITEDGLFYTYNLSDSFSYYYAGVVLSFPHNSLDLRQFTHIEISIDGEKCESMRIFLLANEPTVSQDNDITTWRHLKQIVPFESNCRSYSLPLALFHTPQWWFDNCKTSAAVVEEEPLADIWGIKIESGEGEPVGVDESIVISEIRFYSPVPTLVRYVQSLFVLVALLLLAFRFGLMRRVQIGQYTPVALGNLFDEDRDRVAIYIGDHYSDATLSLNGVADAIAMHPDKVAALIKQGFGQTFKQYLNRLRLTEAQRLLRSTDRQISEIAFAVGFSSVSHFNRMFKQFYSCTPREFRG